MKMASAPEKNNSLDDRMTQCLILMIKEQSSQKQTLEKLVTEVGRLRDNVYGELQKIHESIYSINRSITAGRNCVCGADAGNIQPSSGAKSKSKNRKPPQPSPENSEDDDVDPNMNTRRPEKHKKRFNSLPHDRDQGSRRQPVDSPVPLRSDPPRDVPKPVVKSKQTRRNDKEAPYSMVKESLPHKKLMKSKPQESDFIKLMESLCLEVNRTTIAAITSVAAQMSSNNLASRPAALNTILIIDTSESMRGQAFTTAKNFVNRMIDDIDTSAGEFGLEEYISVITCGESVEIMQPFTNDFLQIRNTVDGLQVGGRTPLMTSLVLALCYLELQSECVRMADHVIMPRLIVVSDFGATLDKHPFTGRDEDISADRIKVQRELFRLGLTFKNQAYTVVCVPVGESNDAVAKEFNAKCTGELVKPQAVQDIGSYYRYQMLIGRALVDRGNRGNQDGDVYSMVQNAMAGAGLDRSHQAALMNLLEKVLHTVDDIDSDDEVTLAGVKYKGKNSKVYERVDGNVNPPDLVLWHPSRNIANIGFEEESGLPSIGSRVRRGKDWQWEDQDDNSPGTVVGHKQKGIAYILWDNDSVGAYRYGYEGKSDVQKTNEPREVRPGEIEVGCNVIRGSDWERGDEDGGPGTIGIVVRKLRDRFVMVKWPSRVIETYRFGADNKWELEVTLGTPHSHGTNTPVNTSESGAEGSQSPASKPTTENGGTKDLKPWWSWRDSRDQWRPFSQASVDKIEVKHNTKNLPQQCLVDYKSKPVKVFLSENNCEIGGERYQIKREMLNADDIESLKMLDEYLPSIN